MRIAVISDVHANPAALRAVLADINAAAPDAVVSCGDLAAGPLPIRPSTCCAAWTSPFTACAATPTAP